VRRLLRSRSLPRTLRALAVTSPLALALFAGPAAAQPCPVKGMAVQVLGSGGPELADRRASSAYLVWLDGRARALVDFGGGAALRFGESGARIVDLDAILLTHLHADHTADLPALVKSSFFEERTAPLPVYGPVGNKFMPSTVTFVRTLFDSARGAYRYLGGFLSPLGKDTYKLKPFDVNPRELRQGVVHENGRLRITAASVAHGQVPALAWRVEAGGRSVVWSGDTNGRGEGLATLARNADLLIAHNAVPEGAGGVERELHMPPSVIGAIAAQAKVKGLVLSHRMLRTLGREDETLAAIKTKYSGPVQFANDLDCFVP
jgi:ribonuclease BN (tRNA processing enzyme)